MKDIVTQRRLTLLVAKARISPQSTRGVQGANFTLAVEVRARLLLKHELMSHEVRRSWSEKYGVVRPGYVQVRGQRSHHDYGTEDDKVPQPPPP